MTDVDVFDEHLDKLYRDREIAYDNEDYDAVREINAELSEILNVDEVDDLDDYDEADFPAIVEDDEYDYYDEEFDN